MLKLVNTPKNKKQLKNIQTKQQIVICPNCQHHFKVINIEPTPSTPTIYKAQNILDKDITQNYNKLTPKNSKKKSDSIVDWKEISIQQTNQQLLISSLNSQMTTIQKLKTLNNINQLKKSRLKAQSSMNRTFSEANSCSPQRQHSNKHQKEVEEQIVKNQTNPMPKVTNTPDPNPQDLSRNTKIIDETHRQVDSQSIVEQGLHKNTVIQILDYLLQWIQSFEMGQGLPGFMKLIIADYKTLRKSKCLPFCPSLKY